MRIKRNVVKIIAFALSAVLLSCSVIRAGTVPVSASTSAEIETGGEEVSYVFVDLKKIADIVLAKQGVVAKYEVLSDVANDYCQLLVDAFSSVYGNIGGTDVTYDRDAFSAVLDEQGIAGYKKEILMEQYDLCCEDGKLGWLENILTVDGTGTALKRYLAGEGIASGETYTVPQEMAQDIVDTFESWWSDEGEYILIRPLEFSFIDSSSLWAYASAYSEYKDFYKNKAGDSLYFMYPKSDAKVYHTGSFYKLDLYNLDNAVLYLSKSFTEGSMVCYDVYGIDKDWNTFYFPCQWNLMYSGGSTDESLWYSNFDPDTSLTSTATSFSFYLPITTKYNYSWFYSNSSQNVRLFKSLDAAKAHTVGEQTVYFTTGYTSTVDNSTTFSGDYYCDTSSSYTYSTVQENIDNSVDSSTEITDSIVDSVVDNSVTNIVNNYTYVSDDAGGSSSSSGSGSSGGSSGDSSVDISGFFSGVGDVVQFILDFLGEVLSVVSTLGTGILELIGSLTDVFSGFTDLLGSAFSFIPEDIIDIISAGIGAIVLIAVWKAFKGG